MLDPAPRVLALETTGTAGSVALLRGFELLAAGILPSEKRSAQSLAPTIDNLLRSANWQPADVELVAVVVGPGSFTGLRVGVTTAKMLAYATGAALLGIGSLETTAAEAPFECRHVAPVIDAGRGQFFAARYRLCCPTDEQHVELYATTSADRRTPPHLDCLESPHLVDKAAWMAALPADCWAIGPGLLSLLKATPGSTSTTGIATDVLARCLPDLAPRASTAGRLAVARYLRGERDDPFQLVPTYLRRSAAEEKRDAAASHNSADATGRISPITS